MSELTDQEITQLFSYLEDYSSDCINEYSATQTASEINALLIKSKPIIIEALQIKKRLESWMANCHDSDYQLKTILNAILTGGKK